MMAAEELGGAVDHQVRAVLQRAAEVGRGRGVVDQQQRAVLVGQPGNVVQRADADSWIGQRLHDDQLGAAGKGEGGGIARVDTAGGDAEAPQLGGEQRGGAAVEVGGGQHLVARFQEGQEGDGQRAHARAAAVGGLGAFELGNSPLQGDVVGQAVAAVDEALRRIGQDAAGRLEVVEEEGRGLVDGLAYRAGGIVLPGVAGEGIKRSEG